MYNITSNFNWLSFTAPWFFWWRPQLLSELPTLSGVGIRLSPAGTDDQRSWDVQRKSKSPPEPCRNGLHAWATSLGKTSCCLSPPKICHRSLAGQTTAACMGLWPETRAVKQMWCMRNIYFFLLLLFANLHFWWSCRIWHSHWSPSSGGSHRTPLDQWHTGSLYSCCARTEPTSHLLPWPSCNGGCSHPD